MSASCRIGALTAGHPTEVRDALTEFGRCFGMVYQLRDDVLDLIAVDNQLGKPAGQDLAEGIYNLPTLVALADETQGEELASLLGSTLDVDDRERARKLVVASGGVEATIERAFEEAGLATPAMAEVLAKSAVEPGRARRLLEILLREKRLVRISEDLVFHQTALARLREMLAGRRAERFNVGAFKEWTGISRKYAIPLLEFLDRERVTRRDGDERVVL